MVGLLCTNGRQCGFCEFQFAACCLKWPLLSCKTLIYLFIFYPSSFTIFSLMDINLLEIKRRNSCGGGGGLGFAGTFLFEIRL